MFKLLEYEKNSFRCNLFSEQDISKWITEHSSTTNTNWCINTKSSNNDSSRYVCRKVYMCHHSGFKKVNSKSNKRGKSKNTECQARIDVKIKLTTKDTCKKDKYIKDDFPAIIIFINEHNHTISSAEALSFLKANNEVRLQFEKYFNDGLGISESLSIHETKIELEFGMNSEQLANASINPKYRTIRHWYDNWKLNNLGSSTEHSVLQKLEEKLNDYKNNGHIVKFSENPFAILVVTPIMQRAHTLAFSKDIAFVDSTSSCDTQSHSVTFMLTSCGIGAVPLGMFITKGQTTDDYKAAFKLLKDSVPCSFDDHGFPKQFIIDDSEAERQALRAIWPESSIFLCRFHVLQSVWRWLWDSKHGIRNEDRKLLFKLFQTILNASNNSSASEAYSIAIGKLVTANNCKNDNIIPLKYDKWIKYVNNYWDRKEVWCLAFRDASIHGNQTNNFSEVNVRIFKDIVLSRNKAYNAVALVDFICTSLEEYYLRRLRTFVNSRNDTARLLFQDQLKRAVYINKNAIEKLPNNIFKVPSETNSGFYEVDVTYGCCNCSKGNLGAYCKHQAAVYHHFNTSMPNLPAITVNCRLLLAKLAFGEHVPDKLFYMPLVCESDSDKINESLNEATPANYENNKPSCSKIPTTLTNQALEVDSNSNSEYYAEQIQELFKSNSEKYTSSTSVSVLSKCLNRLKKVKSAASWESFLSTAGSNISLRHRTRATIRVQPTAINRRKLGITRGSKRLPLGRPLNTDINRKKKRKRNLGENVQKNVPNAKSHGTGH